MIKKFKDTMLTVQSPDKEFEDMKDASLDLVAIGKKKKKKKKKA